MTFAMAPVADLRSPGENGFFGEVAGMLDPLAATERLPAVEVPVDLPVPWFRLRQEGADKAHVRLLAEAVDATELPPILVQEQGSRIIDGLHRLEAAKLRGEQKISARFIACSDAEALVLALRANTMHGMPLSRADRVSAVKRVLAVYPDWSDRAVAAVTGLSSKTIASIRSSVAVKLQFPDKRLGRDGKRRPVASAPGRQRAADYLKAHPDVSLREVARETGVSLGTVHNIKERMRRTESAPPGAAQPAAIPVPIAGARARSLGSAAADHPEPPCSWQAMSAKLAGDPSLRYTENGRAFLRWMAGHCLQAGEWQVFVDAIPEHWRPQVGRIADSMSEQWRQFAQRLGTRVEAAD